MPSYRQRGGLRQQLAEFNAALEVNLASVLAVRLVAVQRFTQSLAHFIGAQLVELQQSVNVACQIDAGNAGAGGALVQSLEFLKLGGGHVLSSWVIPCYRQGSGLCRSLAWIDCGHWVVCQLLQRYANEKAIYTGQPGRQSGFESQLIAVNPGYRLLFASDEDFSAEVIQE